MTKKYLEIKRRHHYVWADYLTRWGQGTKNVYYTTKKGKIANDSVKAIVVEDFFYKITTLKEIHIKVIKGISSLSKDSLQEKHRSVINNFLQIQQTEEFYLISGKKNSEVEQHLHLMKCNVLENIHASHESSALHVINALVNQDLSVLDNETHMRHFMMYFGLQITRTKGFKDRIASVQPRRTNLEITVSDATQEAWWLISYIYGTNIGLSLFLDRKHLTHALLVNETDIPFITSDQPILNVHECVSETEFVEPKHADFYYPLSPKVAYVICDSQNFDNGLNFINEEKAFELNKKMATQAMFHLIGDSEDALLSFQKFLGMRHLKMPQWSLK